MRSEASTVTQYLNSLPEDRKKVMSNLRKEIKKNLPKGFEEVMSYGMIGYVVPHKLYPEGYRCNPKQPLPFINLASQKNYISFYHMALYEGDLLNWFKKEWGKITDKKLDIGKCCVRFKNVNDVPVKLLAELSSKITPAQWVKYYESTKQR